METLEIKVPNKEKARRVLKELEANDDVASVRVLSTKEQRAMHSPKPGVDEVTLASETSLAQDWLSEADDHWDDVYQALCTRKAT